MEGTHFGNERLTTLEMDCPRRPPEYAITTEFTRSAQRIVGMLTFFGSRNIGAGIYICTFFVFIWSVRVRSNGNAGSE